MFGKSAVYVFLAAILMAGIRSSSGQDIVVDNDDGSPGYVESGDWTSGGSAGYAGGAYRYTAAVAGEPTHLATWTPDLPANRRYEIYAAFRQSTNRSADVPFTVMHAGGTTIVRISQSGSNEVVERFLGEFEFEAGTAGSVRLDNGAEPGVVIADAIIWRPVVDPVPSFYDLHWDSAAARESAPVRVTARIRDNTMVTSASLRYHSVFADDGGLVNAYDDGLHDDEEADDGIFGALIPSHPPGSAIGFAFQAEDSLGQLAESPVHYYATGPLPPTVPDLVVDNDDGAPAYTETGNWVLSSGVGFEGGTYHYTNSVLGEPTHSATWSATIPRRGVYEVYAAFAGGTNRTSNAPVTIRHADGESQVVLDQSLTGFLEAYLGQFPFEEEAEASLTIANNADSGVIIADAVIWHRPGDPPPLIERVEREPIVPAAGETVRVTCRASDNVAVTSASLSYRVESIGIDQTIRALDDGTQGDVVAGDGVFTALIPAQPKGSTVSFHCTATDNLDQAVESVTQRYVVGAEPHNVYIVLSSDTSVWGVTGYPGEVNWGVFESRTGVMSKVMNERYRTELVDSLGSPLKVTWFMHGGAWFRTAVNSTYISPTYHIRKNWGDQIERWSDALEYHFHHYVREDDAWVMAPTFEETIWEYEWIMSAMMLDENLFITSFRSGWNYMDNGYQQYLERWVPFRMEGVQSGWVPYHPSFENYREPGDMKGWEVRHHYTHGVSESLARQILGAAASGEDQVVCIWSHQNETDFHTQLAEVHANFHAAHVDFPEVQFQYCSAREAMQKWLDATDSSAPPLEIQSSIEGDTVHVMIRTSDDIYQEQPWVAARTYAEEYVRLDAVKTGTGKWEFDYSRSVYDLAGVGVSDIYGNEALGEVEDGSRCWTIQSEFARAQSRNVDFDTTPTCVLLALSEDGYVGEGTIAFDRELPGSGEWRSIEFAGFTPPGTSLSLRYKTAATQEALSEAAWSPLTADRQVQLPPGLKDAWMRIEVVLEGTLEESPKLDSVEVRYERTQTVFASNWLVR